MLVISVKFQAVCIRTERTEHSVSHHRPAQHKHNADIGQSLVLLLPHACVLDHKSQRSESQLERESTSQQFVERVVGTKREREQEAQNRVSIDGGGQNNQWWQNNRPTN